MAAFDRIYSDEQREAVVSATLDRNVRPMKLVVDLAERGELLYQGRPLRPFHMPLGTARAIVNLERRRRSGRLASALAAAPATSQAEIVRARLMAIADSELEAVEKQVRRGAKPDMTRASRAAKVAREALALRAGSVLERARPINDQASQPPGASTPALRRLAAERASSSTAPDSPPHTQADIEQREPAQAHAENGNSERINAVRARQRADVDVFEGALGPVPWSPSGDAAVPGSHGARPTVLSASSVVVQESEPPTASEPVKPVVAAH